MSRYNYFWPIFIYLVAAGLLAFDQILSMEDQYEQLTHSVDKMDNQIKRAQYEKTKFFHIAGDLLRLSDKDPNANMVVVRYKLRELQEHRPELLNADTPSDVTTEMTVPPPTPTTDTNAPASNAPSAATK